MKKVRHVLGISGGKDSAALAIYLHNKYPQLDVEYYCCDTGKELAETYALIDNLESYLGKKIIRLTGASGSHEDPFDHHLKLYRGFLPSSNSRWCTKKLKLEPFERFVGNDLVVSYVGIRGDEDREGYISKKSNIQSIFPFRRNIWSEDVVSKVLKTTEIPKITELYKTVLGEVAFNKGASIIQAPLSANFTQSEKLNSLLGIGVTAFNKVVFRFLKDTNYPLSQTVEFPLLENEDVLVKADIFKILRESGVGVPGYYEKIPFSVDGREGEYARSRSGCYFCFFQQKIEWVWLYEQHREDFEKAVTYEKEGYTWMQDERLVDLIMPERIKQIKQDYLIKSNKNSGKTSQFLMDILDDSDLEGCAACFI